MDFILFVQTQPSATANVPMTKSPPWTNAPANRAAMPSMYLGGHPVKSPVLDPKFAACAAAISAEHRAA